MTTITTAMVLAAGLGTRIRSLSRDKPKPLVNVGGTALIDHALRVLTDGGVTRAVVNVHYKAEQVEAHLAGVAIPEIVLSDERDELLETGGGILKALPKLGDAPFFCSNTDAILVGGSRAPAQILIDAWTDECDALLLLVPLNAASGYKGEGDFSLADDGRVLNRNDGDPLIFTGLQVLRPRLFAGVEVAPMSTRVFWQKARAAGRMKGVVFDGAWMHVGDPEGFQSAQARLAET